MASPYVHRKETLYVRSAAYQEKLHSKGLGPVFNIETEFR